MRRYEKPKKAHIYFRNGFWRVVHMPPKSFYKGIGASMFSRSWQPAHQFVIRLNNKISHRALFEGSLTNAT